MKRSLGAVAILLLTGSVSFAVDSDGDGVEDPNDCRPLDETIWSPPGPATGLTITGDVPATLEWIAPDLPGADTVFHDVLMSGAAAGWTAAACTEESITTTSATDATNLNPGEIAYFLIRTKNACGWHMGHDSAGQPRSGATCTPFPKPDGYPCALDAECDNGSCTDGFCCESPCDGVCEQCDTAGSEGVCLPSPAGTDPDGDCPAMPPESCGWTGDCAGDRTCALHPQGTTCGTPDCDSNTSSNPAEACDGNGTCVTFASQVCLPYTCDPNSGLCRSSCASSAECAPGYLCRLPQGECRLPVGAACSFDSQCVLDQCVDGYCCDSSCDGLCESCDQAGQTGHCNPVPAGTDPDSDCDAEAQATCGQNGECDGAGGCQLYPSGTECAAFGSCVSPTEYEAPDLCDGAGTCADGGLVDCSPFACSPGECPTACASGADCAPDHSCKLPAGDCLLDDGQICTSSQECYNGACCSLTCTNLGTDVNNCGACGDTCVNPHGTTSCQSGNCYPVCSWPWGSCDYDPDDGCQESLYTVQNCGGCFHYCSPPHAIGTCPSGSCLVASCLNEYADCNGSDGDGCEYRLPTVQGSCGTGSSVFAGSMCGDTRCGWPFNCSNRAWVLSWQSSSYHGSRWFYGRALECSACTADVYAEVELYPPVGTDYDLEVYGPCGTLIGSSYNGGSTPDTVTVYQPERLAYDDSFYYYIKVIWVSGNTCANYTLKTYGRGNCSE